MKTFRVTVGVSCDLDGIVRRGAWQKEILAVTARHAIGIARADAEHRGFEVCSIAAIRVRA